MKLVLFAGLLLLASARVGLEKFRGRQARSSEEKIDKYIVAFAGDTGYTMVWGQFRYNGHVMVANRPIRTILETEASAMSCANDPAAPLAIGFSPYCSSTNIWCVGLLMGLSMRSQIKNDAHEIKACAEEGDEHENEGFKGKGWWMCQVKAKGISDKSWKDAVDICKTNSGVRSDIRYNFPESPPPLHKGQPWGNWNSWDSRCKWARDFGNDDDKTCYNCNLFPRHLGATNNPDYRPDPSQADYAKKEKSGLHTNFMRAAWRDVHLKEKVKDEDDFCGCVALVKRGNKDHYVQLPDSDCPKQFAKNTKLKKIEEVEGPFQLPVPGKDDRAERAVKAEKAVVVKAEQDDTQEASADELIQKGDQDEV